MLRKATKIIAVILTILIVISVTAIAILIDRLKITPANDFWYLTCHVNLGSEYEGCFAGGRLPVLQEKWIVFDLWHYHGVYISKVKADKVLDTLPKVLEILERRAENATDDDCVATGYRNWLKEAPNPPGIDDVTTLVASIKNAFTEHYYKNNPDKIEWSAANAALEQKNFEYRLRKSKWYWASMTFEILWLTGIVWFAAWPMLKRKRLWRFFLHIALLPLLLFLPYYTGYAPYTFTGSSPCGGIAYPFVVIPFNGSMNTFDEIVLEYIPHILEPLAPEVGIPYGLSEFEINAPGPTQVLIAGLLLAVTTAFITITVKKIKQIHTDILI